MPHSVSIDSQAESHQGSSVDTWMITFADLMALLLAFFVLIFSMSDFDAESWDDVVTSLSSDLTPMAVDTPRQSASQAGFVRNPTTRAQIRAGYLKSLATGRFAEEISDGQLAVLVAAGAVQLRTTVSGAEDRLDQDLARSLVAFFETLREPIDISVARASATKLDVQASRKEALVIGEVVFQQLSDNGFDGVMAVYESAPTSLRSKGNGTDIVFSIRAGDR